MLITSCVYVCHIYVSGNYNDFENKYKSIPYFCIILNWVSYVHSNRWQGVDTLCNIAHVNCDRKYTSTIPCCNRYKKDVTALNHVLYLKLERIDDNQSFVASFKYPAFWKERNCPLSKISGRGNVQEAKFSRIVPHPSGSGDMLGQAEELAHLLQGWEWEK